MRLGRQLLALALPIALAACSTSDGTGSGATEPGAERVHFVGISAVESADGRLLAVRTDPLPTAAAGAECHVEVAPEAQETPHEVVVYVFITEGPPSPFERCTTEPRSVTLELSEPVGERVVRDGMGARFWREAGEWVGCDHVVMTCITEPASCDNGTLHAVISNSDVPRRFGMGNLRCEEPYAVVDVDYGAAACPAGEDPNRCAGQLVHRLYWRIDGGAWVLLASDRGPGCGQVTTLVPEFPAVLCADLPELGGT